MDFCWESVNVSGFFKDSFRTKKKGLFFSSFNPCPSVATDDRKPFQCRKIIFGNKTKLLFSGFRGYKDIC